MGREEIDSGPSSLETVFAAYVMINMNDIFIYSFPLYSKLLRAGQCLIIIHFPVTCAMLYVE